MAEQTIMSRVFEHYVDHEAQDGGCGHYFNRCFKNSILGRPFLGKMLTCLAAVSHEDAAVIIKQNSRH